MSPERIVDGYLVFGETVLLDETPSIPARFYEMLVHMVERKQGRILDVSLPQRWG